MSKPAPAQSTGPSPADRVLAYAYQADISRRGLARALIAAAGAAFLFGAPALARAADATRETKDALAAAQQQFDEFQKQMNDLAGEFQTLSEQQDKTIGKIEGVQGQIEEAQGKIDKKQAELEDKQQRLSRRVAESYKTGESNMLGLLLSSGSFDELVSHAYYLNKVNESDQAAIQAVSDIQASLKAQKADLEGQKKQLEDLKARQAAQLEDMKAKKDQVQKLIDGASAQVKELAAKRDAEILAAAAAEEQARKAAAAAAAAKKRQQSGGGAAGVTGGASQGAATAGAQQRVVSACHSVGSPGSGLCALWVSQVFQAAGLGAVGGNADDMYNAWCGSSDRGALKVGMIMAVSSHPHSWAGSIYGHVGIYVGGNTIMDNIGYIRSTSIDSWISYYGATVTPRWGWANGRVLG